MAEALPWIVTIVGLTLMALQLLYRWPRWLGLPFIVITGWATLAGGISPLVEASTGRELGSVANFVNLDTAGYYNRELPGAIGLVLLSYVTLMLGMGVVYVLGNWRWGEHPSAMPRVSWQGTWFHPDTTSRMWRASLALFGFGVLCHAVVASKLIQVAPILKWSSERAGLLFPHGGQGGIYGYAFDLSDTMLIGGWGLLMFAVPSRARLAFAVAANGLFPALQVLFGSRLALIESLCTLVLVYHYGVRRLRKWQWLTMLILALSAFSLLTTLRYDTRRSQEALETPAETLLVPRSISEAAWALRNWPNKIPFFGGEATLHGWQQMFPSARLVDTRSIWQFMLDLFYSGRPPDGFREGGGVHFVFPVEQYVDLGYVGTIGISLLYGLLLGALYEWQARQPNNPFLLLLAVAATSILLAAFDGNMAKAVGGFFFFRLLPIGLMALLVGGLIALLTGTGVVGRHWRARLLLTALYGVVICLLLRALTGLNLFTYLLACFLGLCYICSLFVIHLAGKTQLSVTGSQENANSVWGKVARPMNLPG